MPALTNIGRDDLACTLLSKKDHPSWATRSARGPPPSGNAGTPSSRRSRVRRHWGVSPGNG
ncbi:hypothetical protein [Amycolatopsis sp. lyj-346]|uniref:hypothetical protein n=1 Tax=Amycolatopsis sp. lyj-346 TaxID=2789289 RepID=UPI00397E0D36